MGVVQNHFFSSREAHSKPVKQITSCPFVVVVVFVSILCCLTFLLSFFGTQLFLLSVGLKTVFTQATKGESVTQHLSANDKWLHCGHLSEQMSAQFAPT